MLAPSHSSFGSAWSWVTASRAPLAAARRGVSSEKSSAGVNGLPDSIDDQRRRPERLRRRPPRSSTPAAETASAPAAQGTLDPRRGIVLGPPGSRSVDVSSDRRAAPSRSPSAQTTAALTPLKPTSIPSAQTVMRPSPDRDTRVLAAIFYGPRDIRVEERPDPGAGAGRGGRAGTCCRNLRRRPSRVQSRPAALPDPLPSSRTGPRAGRRGRRGRPGRR